MISPSDKWETRGARSLRNQGSCRPTPLIFVRVGPARSTSELSTTRSEQRYKKAWPVPCSFWLGPVSSLAASGKKEREEEKNSQSLPHICRTSQHARSHSSSTTTAHGGYDRRLAHRPPTCMSKGSHYSYSSGPRTNRLLYRAASR